jgi:3-oxoacyl-[acyl-carrier protein] reductase
MKLAGKNCLVTGGARGLGRELCQALVLEGANVGTLDVDATGLQLISESCGVWSRICDVTDDAQVANSIAEYAAKFKSIDVLINNAGFIYSAPLVNLLAAERRHSLEMWDRVINLNLRSVFLMTSYAAEAMMVKRTKGVIVNISSISAHGNPGQSAYSAAKAGVNSVTAAWARELGLLGIRVVAVAPGFVDTESTRAALSESVLKEWVNRVPLRRLARVEEFTSAVLACIENDYFNGKVLEIDGGLEL